MFWCATKCEMKWSEIIHFQYELRMYIPPDRVFLYHLVLKQLLHSNGYSGKFSIQMSSILIDHIKMTKNEKNHTFCPKLFVCFHIHIKYKITTIHPNVSWYICKLTHVFNYFEIGLRCRNGKRTFTCKMYSKIIKNFVSFDDFDLIENV